MHFSTKSHIWAFLSNATLCFKGSKNPALHPHAVLVIPSISWLSGEGLIMYISVIESLFPLQVGPQDAYSERAALREKLDKVRIRGMSVRQCSHLLLCDFIFADTRSVGEFRPRI